MVKEKLTKLEFEILELFRDGRLSENDDDYKMIYLDNEKSSSLFSLLDDNYLIGYWTLDKTNIFYVEMTEKGKKYYIDNKEIERELTELDIYNLKIIHWHGGKDPIYMYDHLLKCKNRNEKWETMNFYSEQQLVKIIREPFSLELYCILTKKAEDYLWLHDHK